MKIEKKPLAGGCQCGAIRFACDGLGRASICHCRMCQKATGGFFGPYVGGPGARWTRGKPKHFQSSNLVKRGFCGACGTPLSFELDGWIEFSIGAFDDPAAIEPAVQVAVEHRLPWFDKLAGLPGMPEADAAAFSARCARVVSYQHGDRED